MQPRVIGGVLALLALAIALFFFLRKGDEKKPKAPDSALVTPNGPKLNAAPGTGTKGSGVGTPMPRVKMPTDPSCTGGGTDDVKTYVTDTGNLVRDHRANVTDPKALP